MGVTYARCIAEGERNKTVLAIKDLIQTEYSSDINKNSILKSSVTIQIHKSLWDFREGRGWVRKEYEKFYEKDSI